MAKHVTPDAYPGLTEAERRQIDRVLQGWRAGRDALLRQKSDATRSAEAGLTLHVGPVKTAL